MKLLLPLLSITAIVLASPKAFPGGSYFPLTCSQCIPFPEQNQCDITTSCVNTSDDVVGPLYCACRAGYKADPTACDPNDITAQFRLPWPGQEGRVFVRPGIPCNTLCDHYELGAAGCAEVQERDECYYD